MDPRKPLWTKDESSPSQLRRPILGANFVNKSEDSPQQMRQPQAAPEPEPVVQVIPPQSSKLSATAAEWYPPGMRFMPPLAVQPVSATSSVQGRLKKFKEPEQPPYFAVNGASSASQPPMENVFELDDRRLRQIISTLTNDPGQFDDLIDVFVESLVPYFGDITALSSVTKLLVQEAVNKQSFRYTCARLCCYIEEGCPTFRAQLHLTCQRELDRNVNTAGLLMFIAELYIQLYHENLYGKCVLDAIKLLLSQGGDANVKCVCQALKLTGYALERYDKKAMDSVMDQLESSKPTVNGTALALLNSVLNLRNAQWGHMNESDTSSMSDGIYGQGEGPVPNMYYSVNGNNLTYEESEFLASNLQHNDDFLTDDTSDPDELCDPEPEMDEEIQKAFKEFVKLSKR